MANPYKDGQRVLLHGLSYIYRRRIKALLYEFRTTSKIEIAPLIIHFRYQDCWESGGEKYKTPEDVVKPPAPQKTSKADKFIADVQAGRYTNKVFALRALGRASGHGSFPDVSERQRVHTFIDEFFADKPAYTPTLMEKVGRRPSTATAVLKAQLFELRKIKELLSSMNSVVKEGKK